MNPRRKMFLRILSRPLVVRRGRTLTALLAVVVAASVATATLNLYTDVQAKLHKEFRSYGANVIVTVPEGETLPTDALARVEATIAGRGNAAPFGYVVAHTVIGSPVVVAGADMERARRLNGWWAVTAWPQAPGAALLGARAAQVLAPDGKPFEISFHGRKLTVTPAGTLRTGAGEDSRVYLALTDFQAWTGLTPSTIEVAVTGSADEITAYIARLVTALPEAQVRPVRQIVEAEARVLDKTRAALWATSAIIVFTAALCMLATLTASVLDRRKDFAVMKALGASNRAVNALFAAEAAAIGVVGAILGFAIGVGIAVWIGRVNFNAAVVPRFGILPAVLGGSVLVALLSATLPMALLGKVQPAAILRGE
jgi:putative ABC transport system permease protein